MRRITIVALAAILTLTCGGIALAHTTPRAAHTAAAPTVKLAKTHVGTILVTASKLTVYEFTADGHDKDVCATRKGCTSTWPPLTVTARPVAGSGVSAHLLGAITLAHGVKQVTYAGHPLYRYDLDSPGSTSYVGVKQYGGSWYGVSASGGAVK